MSRSVLKRPPSHLGMLTLSMVVATAPSLGHASGFFNQERSVRGLGRAYSGEAADRGAASLAWNPAAIARSGGEVYVDVHGRFFSNTLSDRGSNITRPIVPGGLTTPVGGPTVAEDSTDDDTPINGVVVVPVNDRFALGFSAGSPFLLRTDYDPTFWGRYDTVNAKVDTTELQGSVAVGATPWLDLGFGVSAQYTEALLASALPNLMPTAPDGRSQVTGEGWNYGWTAGAQAHFDRGSIGASFKSGVTQDLEGQLTISGLLGPLAAGNLSTPSEASFGTPWIASVAGRWKVTPQLTLNAQAQRFGWSEYETIHIHFPGGREDIKQNFSDTTTIGVGADYEVNPILTLRGGIQVDETPTPDDLREPGIPDSDRTLYAVGASLNLRPSVTLDAALGYMAFQGARIFEDSVFFPGTGADTITRVRGQVETEATIVSAGLRWKF